MADDLKAKAEQAIDELHRNLGVGWPYADSRIDHIKRYIASLEGVDYPPEAPHWPPDEGVAADVGQGVIASTADIGAPVTPAAIVGSPEGEITGVIVSATDNTTHSNVIMPTEPEPEQPKSEGKFKGRGK